MSPDGAFKAVTTAQSRELTVEEAQRLIAWMTGQSRPPQDAREDRSAKAPSRSVSLIRDSTRREILRARLWRDGRSRGPSEDVIEARFRDLTEGELTVGGRGKRRQSRAIAGDRSIRLEKSTLMSRAFFGW